MIRGAPGHHQAFWLCEHFLMFHPGRMARPGSPDLSHRFLSHRFHLPALGTSVGGIEELHRARAQLNGGTVLDVAPESEIDQGVGRSSRRMSWRSSGRASRTPRASARGRSGATWRPSSRCRLRFHSDVVFGIAIPPYQLPLQVNMKLALRSDYPDLCLALAPELRETEVSRAA
jgi:hypothetical protein